MMKWGLWKPVLGMFLLFGLVQPPSFAETPFEEAVRSGNFSKALSIICKKYRMDCRKVQVERNMESWGYNLDLFSGRIIISSQAFTFNGRSPSEGWAAAMVGHELVHRNQSKYVRSVANVRETLFKDYYWRAALELKAWGWMLENEKLFHFDESQLYEIDTAIHCYRSIMDLKGKMPPKACRQFYSRE